MTQNIEQRTEVAVVKYEKSSEIVDKLGNTDATVETPAGLRASFPKLSRELKEDNIRREGDFQHSQNNKDKEFQLRFSQSQTTMSWQAGVRVSDKFQRYSVGVVGSENYKEYLPNPEKLPFDTGSSIDDDLVNQLWLENGVPSKDYTDEKDSAVSQEVSGKKVFPYKITQSVIIGDPTLGVIPSNVDSLRINGSVYVMEKPVSGELKSFDLSIGKATIGDEDICLYILSTKIIISDVTKFPIKVKNGQRAKLNSWHPVVYGELPYEHSGGDYIFMASYPKDLHNGGTAISPTVPISLPFTNQAIADFVHGNNESDPGGIGVWVRLNGNPNISCFGADPLGEFYSDAPISSCIRTLYVSLPNGTIGADVSATPGIFKIEYPIVFPLDYIKFRGAGSNVCTIWKPGNKIRIDLGTNLAPNRDEVGGCLDRYDVDAFFIYMHPDKSYRYGCEVSGVRLLGKSENPEESLTSYKEYGIYAPRAAMLRHNDILANRVHKLYFTYDTWKHTCDDLHSNFGGGIFYYEPDETGKEASGTSLNASNCFASRPLSEAGLFVAAYHIVGLEYSTLTACSADNMFEPWRLKSSNLDISSGSTEIARSTSAFVIDGGNVTFTNLRTVSPAHQGDTKAQMLCKGGAKVKLIGGKMSGRANPDADDIGVLVTDGASLIADHFEFPPNGIPYKIDMTSATPASSAVITDEFGISQIFDTQNPEGYFNAPKIPMSENTLLNKGSLINNRHKYRGREVISQQTSKTLTATGPQPEDSWVDPLGNVVISPK